MKKYVFYALISLMSINVFAQNVMYYEGAMKIPSDIEPLCRYFKVEMNNNGRNTQGNYSYYINASGEKVMHGDIRISSRFINALDAPVEIIGNYVGGLRNGRWIVSYMKNGESVGSMQRLEVGFEYNYLSGQYMYSQSGMELNSGSYLDSYSGFIANGRIQGKVTWKRTRDLVYEMKGEIDRNGLPTGIWLMTQRGRSSKEIDIIQRRLYRNGALVFVEETDKSTREWKMCFCAFEGITKTPIVDKIYDTVVGDYDCIVYKGKIAHRVNLSKYNYKSRIKYGNMGSWEMIPDAIIGIDNSLVYHMDMWRDVYSEKEFLRGTPGIPATETEMPELATELEVVEDDNELSHVIEVTNAEEYRVPDYSFYIVPEEEVEEEPIFVLVEENPEFPGGEVALFEYLNKNIQYPKKAAEAGIEGTVVVKFVVERDGSITKAQILRDIGNGCGDEALRVVNSMPRWKPGKQGVKYVRCEFTLPVQFHLH